MLDLDLAATLERPAEGDLVGVLEVSTYRQSTRQPRHAQPERLQHPCDVGRGRLALEVGVGREDHLGDLAVGELVGVEIKAGGFDGSDPDDLSDLGDMIVAAYRDAKGQADGLASDALGPLAGGGGLPGLGG